MAELFLARDTETNALVVIKRILPYLSKEADFVHMFLDEARIAAQLHHSNIVRVHELGQLDGCLFISMEYVEGFDLRKIFKEEQRKQGTLPYPLVAYVVSRVCAGLSVAHHGVGLDGRPLQVIHRDVSPQNVMVSTDGEVKLVDFGIAKAASVVERSKPGEIKGKFLYLSPEQLVEGPIDHRADLFAVGVMLYELTVGKSPFHKASSEAVILAIRTEEPGPPHLARDDFPMELSRVIMRCLKKDPAKRYQQAVEVQAELERYLARSPFGPEELARYVRELFGIEDERTVMIDSLSPKKVAAALKSPARSVPSYARAGETVEATATASVSEHSAEGLKELLEEPTRPQAVEPDDEASETKPFRPELPPDPETTPFRPELPPEPQVFAKAPRGSRPQRDHALTGELSVTKAPSTANNNWRGLLAGFVAITAAIAVAAGLLINGRRARSLAPEAPVDPAEISASIEPEPLETVPAAKPVAAEPPPPSPKPAPKPTSPKPPPKVTVIFQAPSKTRIQDAATGDRFAPGSRVQLPSGQRKIHYRCPPKRGRQSPLSSLALTVRGPKDGTPQLVSLCKKGR